MRIFNENKDRELSYADIDYGKGHLKPDTLIKHIAAQKGVKEEGHYITVAEYDGGGKDVEWVVDVAEIPEKDARDEAEEILVYVLYTESELEKVRAKQRISELKKNLADSDYKAIKYAEGELSEAEYSETKILRREWRTQINELEKI